MDISKYQGVIPAFYACYEDDGSVSPARTRALARYLLNKGVRGLYVGGSSGECIYQSVEERKLILEHGIAQYWNDISAAAPNTDFIIYNIPQLAGVALTMSLLRTMRKNPRVIGVKNSSMPSQDIQLWKDEGGADFVVMNGPDEEFVSGLAMGATGGIGGTYAVMPELFQKVYDDYHAGKVDEAAAVQNEICRIIYAMCAAHGNLYAVLKAILAKRGVDCGSVRKPLPALIESDLAIVDQAAAQIDAAIAKYC